jgi:hypothetical protein
MGTNGATIIRQVAMQDHSSLAEAADCVQQLDFFFHF